MKLAIDIGNTSVACGLFKNAALIKRFNIQSLNQINNYIDNQLFTDIHKIIISSVVPSLTNDYINFFKKITIDNIQLINYKSGNLSLQVPYPKTVGSDRICNIFATLKLYHSPAIIVDFGTATTYDVINSKNEFIGGAIGAGIETSANYLINSAALLDKTDLQFPNKAIGVDTKENIQSGIMFGAIDQVEGMIKRIIEEKNNKYTIVLTGGLSKLLSPKLSINHILDMDLTLKGIFYIDELENV